MAQAAGISRLVVGLTVVAFGTSSPELAVVLTSNLTGQSDLSVGNVVGSNICNVLLILGFSAAIAPLVASRRLIRQDVPVMILVSAAMYPLAADGLVSRWEGLLLFVCLPAYTIWLIRKSRRSTRRERLKRQQQEAGYTEPPKATARDVLVDLLLIAGGLALLVIGSKWLVNSAVQMAEIFGVQELIIGLTVVAIGTSLPELATSVVAVMRGERDIAVGNVVGSNVFNILLVLGLSSALSPGGIAVTRHAIQFDIPVMIAVALACLPIFFIGYRIARWEGFLFLLYFVAYNLYLVLDAVNQDRALSWLRDVLAVFVIPLTVLTLLILTVRWWKKENRK